MGLCLLARHVNSFLSLRIFIKKRKQCNTNVRLKNIYMCLYINVRSGNQYTENGTSIVSHTCDHPYFCISYRNFGKYHAKNNNNPT